METFPAVIPYRHTEVSAIISRSGVSDVVVKLVTDDGLVGWGEACMNCDTATTLAAIEAMRPFVLGRSPWQTEAIARDVFVHGGWQWEAMTGSFAFAGIDMALWDLCGKAAGQPLSHLFGGPVLHHFSLAMVFGCIVGTYSSIAVAVPDLMLHS